MKTFILNLIVGVGAAVLLATNLLAQVGNENPTGTSGQYNGNVTTGCSWDPYTSNSSRSSTDLTIAGGVSAYPLAFTRTTNSRYTAGLSTPFGQAGSWNHSYNWTVDSTTVTKKGKVGLPASYTVNYPDGRRVSFNNRNPLPSGNNDPDFRGPLGVRDRFEQLTAGATECNLRLADGGKVHFHATVTTSTEGSGTSTIYKSTYQFSLVEIIDPYGQKTAVTQTTNSTTIREPAGRTITISYTQGPAGDKVVQSVVGSDGRSVIYNYQGITKGNTPYTALMSVRYFGDASLDATYTYQSDNIDSTGRPLIATATDPMYDGPMWKIAYNFAVPGVNSNGDGSSIVSGQLLREKHPNGTAVSTLTVNAKTSDGSDSRTETRGDGPSRTFNYKTYRLKKTSDFKNVFEVIDYDNSYYLQAITDRRGNSTDYQSNQYNGNVTLVKQPLSDDVFPADVRTQTAYTYGNPNAADPNNRDPKNPYYLASIEDGNGKVAQEFHRYPGTMQVQKIKYAPHTYNYVESFTYNQFGQVLAHVTRRGFTESYEYDPGNPSRVSAYRDAEHQDPDNQGIIPPTASYGYDGYGRVSSIRTPRLSGGTTVYDTTRFFYNLRGQLTQLTHPNGDYIQYGYNPNGTLAWTADERHPGAINDPAQRTSYDYDDYKRLRHVTTPLRASGDSTPRVTEYIYDPGRSGENYTRTAAAPTKIVSPEQKVTLTDYDENLRTRAVTVVGDANVPNATTSYTYDENGNALTVKDPNGQSTGAVTAYHYDKQNRVSSMEDPIPTDRNDKGHTWHYLYDTGGNRIKEFRADNQVKQYLYDDFGRVRWIFDYGSSCDVKDVINTGSCSGTIINEIQFGHDQEDNVIYEYVELPSGATAIYSFGYDKLNRKTSATYPIDYSGARRTETYEYDVGNRLWHYINPAGQVKTLTYDNRGRLTDTSWSNDPSKGNTGPAVHINYDSTRPTGISTTAYSVAGVNIPATSIVFGYDEANNRTYEDQTISGLPTRRVQTIPDGDGNRKNLIVSTGGTQNFANNFEYTSRNELRTIYNGASGFAQALFTYSYDASGNVTQRQGWAVGGNITSMLYDALNRAYQCTHSIGGATSFSVSNYAYSKIGNLDSVTRASSAYEDGRGDYVGQYNLTNELTGASYSADPGGSNPAKSVTYTVVNKVRDSVTVADNTVSPATTTTTSYTRNDINQYTTITVAGTSRSVMYDNNFNLTSYNGWGYAYNAENRLISVSGNGHNASFAYDAVGRCVKRVIDNVTTVLTYDQWTPILEWDGSGNLTATNIYGLGDDEILSRSSGGNQWYYKNDPMGNVRFVIKGNGSTGTIAEKYTYDAFGSPTISQFNGIPSPNNRFMFSGREYFSSLGLYDMRNRVYDPVVGRFYQTDPIGLEGDLTNLYRFSGNNPLLGGDPSGLQGTDEDPSKPTFTFSLSPYSSEAFLDEVFGTNSSSGGQSSFNFYFDSDPVYIAGLGGAADFVPVLRANIGQLRDPTEHSALWRVADRTVRRISGALSALADQVGFNQGDLDALALMPVTAPVFKTGRAIEGLSSLLGRAAKIAREEPLIQGAIPAKLYHYTTLENAPDILKVGILRGRFSGKVFTTPMGAYRPIEAQMYLGLPPNSGLPGAMFEVDTNILRAMGIKPIGGPMRVLPTRNAMGSGIEVIFDQPIPPTAVRRVPWP